MDTDLELSEDEEEEEEEEKELLVERSDEEDDDLRSGRGRRERGGLVVGGAVGAGVADAGGSDDASELSRFLLGRVSRVRTLTLLPTLAAADSGSRRRSGRRTFDSAAPRKCNQKKLDIGRFQ